jgi:hypothetical protein
MIAASQGLDHLVMFLLGQKASVDIETQVSAFTSGASRSYRAFYYSPGIRYCNIQTILSSQKWFIYK